MALLVHVIAPDGTRHERAFPDTATPEQIVAAVRAPQSAFTFGRTATVVKTDKYSGKEVPHADHTSPWVVDHPDTRIVVGRDDGAGNFVETQHLAGPKPAQPAPEEAK